LQYAIASFTFYGGQLSSLGGYESNNPTKNLIFSFSQLSTFAEPSTHLGLRGTYAVNNMLDVSLGANNGWSTFHHAGRLRTLELSTQWRPRPALSTSFALYSGKQYMLDALANGPQGIRNFGNFSTIFNVTDKLNLIIDADYGVQSKGLRSNSTNGNVVWSGVSGYINYLLTERWYTTVRGGLFNDQNGFRTGVRQCLKELTLTVGFRPIKQLLLRAEARQDFSNRSSFVNNNAASKSNNLQSFALEGLYMFA
jgi:hypothetical protein